MALVCLGGALLGAMLGVFVGGLLWLAYGAFVGDFTGGLEWALLGGAGMGLAGAVYGCALELTAGPDDRPGEPRGVAVRGVRQEGVPERSLPRPGR
jgi:hypothetical protein